MSRYLQNVNLSGRGLENEWLNNTVSSHNLFCGCDQPWYHLQYLLQKQDNKWRLTEEHTGEDPTTNGEEDAFSEGDLKQLFDAEQEETTEPTG